MLCKSIGHLSITCCVTGWREGFDYLQRISSRKTFCTARNGIILKDLMIENMYLTIIKNCQITTAI